MPYSAMTAKILKSIRMSVALGVALLLISQPLQAQQSAGAQKQAAAPLRTFSQGPLTWADFQAAAAPDRSSDCWLEYSYLFDTVTRRSHGARYLVNQLSCLVDPQLSFARPEVRTPQMLAYSQVLFNLAELQCRYLQPVLCQSGWDYASDSIVALAFKQNDYDVKLFHYESYYGTDSLAVFRWLDSTNRLLAQLPTQPPLKPHYSGSIFALNIGLGFAHIGGNYTQALLDPIIFHFGAHMGSHRSAFFWDLNAGGNFSRQPFFLCSRAFDAYTDYSYLQFYFGYGYYLLQRPTFAIMPLAGLGCAGISATQVEGSSASTDYADFGFSFMAGVNFDFKLNRRFTCNQISLTHDDAGLDLGLRLFVANNKFQTLQCQGLSDLGRQHFTFNAMLTLGFSYSEFSLK